jgi:DNA invertase Pin-like site-specific DNA recombinase
MPNFEKIGYARVSTTDQDPELQHRILMDAGIPDDFIFIDKGVSGTIAAEKRPAFQRMLIFAKEHSPEVKYLYVYEISRLGRNTYDTINTLSSLEKMGLMVWSLSPNEEFTRSSDTSIRQLLIMIMSWVAQRERDNLSARTKAGLDVARANGKILGKPRAEIDFNLVNQMRIEGKTWDNVADYYKITIMTLYRARKRRGEL